jgi:hypothetical protein
MAFLETMDLQTFLSLPTTEIARCVQENGPRACVFLVNGTRRWFTLEYGEKAEHSPRGYFEIVKRRHLEICRMFFDYGVEILLFPAFGMPHQNRGEHYVPIVVEAMTQLTSNPDYLEFYQTYGVRLRFYGDYRKYLAETAYASLGDLFDRADHYGSRLGRHRLLVGVFAHDATETAAELAVRYYQTHGRVPDRSALIEMYYGEPVPPVDMFIGFSKFRAFYTPMLATGREALYFTVSPSLYITEGQWREILYDYLYARHSHETDYAALSPEARAGLKNFYRANIGKTIGVGGVHKPSGQWYPLPQVQLPPGFSESENDTED